MNEFWMTQLEFFGRILLSGLCGAFIGYERKNHMKAAGIRTHFIVAIASALIMIVSKYGFADVVGEFIKLDPSRIAAQIVSGIGFLGAGMIFIRGQSVNGLTTAAGVWGTAGVGMAIGAGQYLIGLLCAICIFVVQALLHKTTRVGRSPISEGIVIRLDSSGAVPEIQQRLRDQKIEILSFKAEKKENGEVLLDIQVKLPPKYDASLLLTMFESCEAILSIEV